MPGSPTYVLAIDTATDICSVAVLHGDRLIELAERVGSRHSECVLPMVEAALAAAALKLGDVDLFAFGAGPGSFTGLRIACGVCQGLAYGKQKRVVGIGNLRALAANAFESVNAGDLLLAAVDARMSEAYCAIYRRDESISEIRSPALERPKSLTALAFEAGVNIVAGNAITTFADAWPGDKRWVELPDVSSSAGAIAKLARMDAARGLSVAPANAVPVYVRDHIALTIEERRRSSMAAQADITSVASRPS
ncbi:MAG: tRNA (adenosine(37)-N6)-threonylcarbamoyltransferase complex dimerization subunit type 1 TsaB [Burkholderiaceae bacterium]